MKLMFFGLSLFFSILVPVFANAQVDDYENNPVLEPSLENTFDKYRVSNPVVLRDGSEYKMYYIGLGDSNHVEIGGASSQDGIIRERLGLMKRMVWSEEWKLR